MARSIRVPAIIRSIAGVGGAAAAGHLLTLAAMPLVSRLYSKEDFGRFGLFFGLANILSIASLLGLHDALLTIRDEREAQKAFTASAFLILVSTPILAIATYVLIAFDLFGYGALPNWGALAIPLYSALIGACMLAQIALVRSMHFRKLAMGHLALGLTRPICQIGAGSAGLAFGGLVVADITSRAVAAWLLLKNASQNFDAKLSFNAPACLSVAWQYRRFMFSRTPSIFLFSIGTALPSILVMTAYGISSSGVYTLMFSVIAGPIGLVQKAVGDVFLGHLANLLQSNPENARRFLLSTVGILLICSLAPAMILLLFGPTLFAVLFGESWRDSGSLARLMVPLFVADLTIGPVGGALNVLNVPGRKLYFDIARIFAFLAAYYVATIYNFGLPTMIGLMSGFGVIGYLIYFATTLHAFRKVNQGRISATRDRQSTPDLPLP